MVECFGAATLVSSSRIARASSGCSRQAELSGPVLSKFLPTERPLGSALCSRAAETHLRGAPRGLADLASGHTDKIATS